MLIVDDLLATGGTACAAAELTRNQGGEVRAFAFVIELDFLSGRDQVAKATPGAAIYSLVHFGAGSRHSDRSATARLPHPLGPPLPKVEGKIVEVPSPSPARERGWE